MRVRQLVEQVEVAAEVRRRVAQGRQQQHALAVGRGPARGTQPVEVHVCDRLRADGDGRVRVVPEDHGRRVPRAPGRGVVGRHVGRRRARACPAAAAAAARAGGGGV